MGQGTGLSVPPRRPRFVGPPAAADEALFLVAHLDARLAAGNVVDSGPEEILLGGGIHI